MTETKKKVGIVGGGKVGLTMFNLFFHSQLTEVAYVVDMNVSAPAREAARTVSIANFDNLDKIPQIPVDFIVEVTGAQKVVDQLVRMVAEKNIQIITHDMAYIIMQVLEENNHRSSQLVS